MKGLQSCLLAECPFLMRLLASRCHMHVDLSGKWSARQKFRSEAGACKCSCMELYACWKRQHIFAVWKVQHAETPHVPDQRPGGQVRLCPALPSWGLSHSVGACCRVYVESRCCDNILMRQVLHRQLFSFVSCWHVRLC